MKLSNHEDTSTDTIAESGEGNCPCRRVLGVLGVSFETLKQIDAGVLNIGYAEAGPVEGPARYFCTAVVTTFTPMSTPVKAIASAGLAVKGGVAGGAASGCANDIPL